MTSKVDPQSLMEQAQAIVKEYRPRIMALKLVLDTSLQGIALLDDVVHYGPVIAEYFDVDELVNILNMVLSKYEELMGIEDSLDAQLPPPGTLLH